MGEQLVVSAIDGLSEEVTLKVRIWDELVLKRGKGFPGKGHDLCEGHEAGKTSYHV